MLDSSEAILEATFTRVHIAIYFMATVTFFTGGHFDSHLLFNTLNSTQFKSKKHLASALSSVTF